MAHLIDLLLCGLYLSGVGGFDRKSAQQESMPLPVHTYHTSCSVRRAREAGGGFLTRCHFEQSVTGFAAVLQSGLLHQGFILAD